MPRTSRMLVSDEKAVYQVMSRTALDGFPLMVHYGINRREEPSMWCGFDEHD